MLVVADKGSRNGGFRYGKPTLRVEYDDLAGFAEVTTVIAFFSKKESFVPYWHSKPPSIHLRQAGLPSSPTQLTSIITLCDQLLDGSYLHFRLRTRHLKHPVLVLLRRVLDPVSAIETTTGGTEGWRRMREGQTPNEEIGSLYVRCSIDRCCSFREFITPRCGTARRVRYD